MKPVYIINGFLESGKTEFIVYTLAQPYFQLRGKTLLVLCESPKRIARMKPSRWRGAKSPR